MDNQLSQPSNARARAEAIRTCTKCQATLPLAMFPMYRSNGYSGYRRQCRDCVRAYRTRWEMNLGGPRAERYYARKRRADARRKRRERSRRYRERLAVLRSVLTAMIAQGMTRAEIARGAAVSVRTVRRILTGDGGRTRFQQRTEERILGLYLDVRGTA